MRAAYLASVFFLIIGVAAGFGVHTIGVDGQPVTGLKGFLIGLVLCPIPPLAVKFVKRLRGPRD